jgi:serine/threonine protein kinase
MAVASADEFFAVLKKSKLLDDEAFGNARDATRDLAEPKQIARRLYKQGALTKWQAAQLLTGRHGMNLGKYKLLDQLGADSTGRVYLAEHSQMERRVALKTLEQRDEDGDEKVEQFLAETSEVAALDHRNIVHIYDVNKEGGRYYLVMEYVQGRTLKSLVADEGPLAYGLVAEYIRQAAAGLSHIHKRNMLHRDVRPANVMIDQFGTIKIMNVGLTRSEWQDDTTKSDVTFAASEVARGSRAQKGSDIFSLGCVAYYLLTGRPPFPQETYQERIEASPNLEPPDVLDSRPDASESLIRICRKMVSNRPADRQESADEVETAMATWLDQNEGNRPAIATGSEDEIEADLDDTPPPAPALSKNVAAEELPAVVPPVRGATPPAANKSAANKPAAAAATAVGIAIQVDAPRRPAVVTEPAHGPKGSGKSNSLVVGVGAGAVAVVLIAAGLFFFLRGDGGTETAGANEKTPPKSQTVNVPITRKTIIPKTTTSRPDVGVKKTPVKTTEKTDKTNAVKTGVLAKTTAKTGETKTLPKNGGPNRVAKADPKVDPKTPKVDPKVNPKDPPSAKKPVRSNLDPFKEFASAITLPPLAEDMTEEERRRGMKLGLIDAPMEKPCYITLIGGKLPYKDKKTFSLEPPNGGTVKDRWEIKIDQPNEAISGFAIATIARTAGALYFRWEKKALTNANSNYVRNCMLQIECGSKSHMLNLRDPGVLTEKGEPPLPMVTTLDKRTISTSLAIPWAPDQDQLHIEITALAIVETKARYEPTRVDPKKDFLASKESVYLVIGEPKPPVLLYKITCRKKPREGLVLMATAHIAREFKAKSHPAFSMSRVKSSHDEAKNLLITRLTPQDEEADVARQPPPKKERVERVKQFYRTKRENANAVIKATERIMRAYETLNGKGAIHYRVYVKVNDNEIDLLRTKAPKPIPKNDNPFIAKLKNAGAEITFHPRSGKVSGVVMVGGGFKNGHVHWLHGFKQLESLEFSGGNKHINSKGLAHLVHLKNLQTLTMKKMAIDDSGLAHLKQLPKLTRLEIVDSPITSDGLAHIAAIPALTSLTLKNIKVDETGLATLKTMKKLKELTLLGPKNMIPLTMITALKTELIKTGCIVKGNED